MPLSNFRLHGIYYGMEILILVLLYYLSQNADFADSIKPLMSQIKDSEEMLRFLNDLSKFTQTFSTFADKTDGAPKDTQTAKPPKEEPAEQKKDPQSPTEGIADAFIQNILDSYLKKHSS